jgi:hypothetical protein
MSFISMTNNMTYVVQAPLQRNLKKRVTVAVAHGSGVRKLFKIAFRNSTPDIYIAFPYLTVPSYRAGVVVLDDGQQTIDTAAMFHSSVPIKLSLHESGVVHCKAQDNAPHGGTILARKLSYPFVNFDGQHILTVEADQVSAYELASAEEQARNDFLTFTVPPNCDRVKITAFAGYTAESVSGKYALNTNPLPPSATLRFVRPSLTRPLYVGLYIFGGGTLQQGSAVQPTLIALAAMEPTSWLTIHANDPLIGHD